jgi:outer membrane lipase/esterase
LPAPCPAQTGLDGFSQAELASQSTLAALAPLSPQGFAVPTVNHVGCYGYAQGGARVSSQPGIGNALLGGTDAILGNLTVPVVTQIQNHLNAVGSKFSGTEVVFVLAGANDVFFQLITLQTNSTTAGTTAVTNAVGAQVQADVKAGTCTPTDAQASNCTSQAEAELWQVSLGSAAAATAAVSKQVSSDVAAGTCTPTDAQASNCVTQAETELVTAYLTATGNAAAAAYITATGAPAAVQARAQAGTELAGYVNSMIIGNGAKYVTVINIPDIGTSPFGEALNTPANASVWALLNTMVATFNTQLQAGLTGNPNVVFVDANTQSHLNTQDPGQYGLTNVTTPACNLAPTANPLDSSLVCTTANVIAGDVSHYLFADTVHPTPYGYSVLAKYVATQMALRGWL